MSDMSQGQGWWQASDGLWYSPERHPDYVAPLAPALPGASGGQPGQPIGTVSLPTGGGGRVLTVDRETPPEPVWRAGSRRPSMAAASSSSSAEPRSGTTLSTRTVSNQVPALKVFLLVGVGFATLHLLTYLSLRSEFEHSVAFVARTTGTSHSLILASYVVQGFAVLDLVIFLALLLSRSFRTVRGLMALVFGWSLVSVVLGLVLRSPVATGWALVTALYVGFVFGCVGRARAAESFSERDVAQKDSSSFELILAVYVVLLTVATALVTLNLYSTTTPSSGTQGLITYASGSSGPHTPGVDPPPPAYVEQTVTAHDFKVSLNFDPNSNANLDYHAPLSVGGAAPVGVDGVDIGGNLLRTSTPVLITVNREGSPGAIKMDTASCQTPGAAGVAPNLSFTATIMGQSTTACGVFNAVLTFFNAGAYQYELRFSLPEQFGSLPATSATLQSIATSVSVQ